MKCSTLVWWWLFALLIFSFTSGARAKSQNVDTKFPLKMSTQYEIALKLNLKTTTFDSSEDVFKLKKHKCLGNKKPSLSKFKPLCKEIHNFKNVIMRSSSPREHKVDMFTRRKTKTAFEVSKTSAGKCYNLNYLGRFREYGHVADQLMITNNNGKISKQKITLVDSKSSLAGTLRRLEMSDNRGSKQWYSSKNINDNTNVLKSSNDIQRAEHDSLWIKTSCLNTWNIISGCSGIQPKLDFRRSQNNLSVTMQFAKGKPKLNYKVTKKQSYFIYGVCILNKTPLVLFTKNKMNLMNIKQTAAITSAFKISNHVKSKTFAKKCSNFWTNKECISEANSIQNKCVDKDIAISTLTIPSRLFKIKKQFFKLLRIFKRLTSRWSSWTILLLYDWHQLLCKSTEFQILSCNIWGASFLLTILFIVFSVFKFITYIPKLVLDMYEGLQDTSKAQGRLLSIVLTFVLISCFKQSWLFWMLICLFSLFYYWSGHSF